MQSIGGSVKQVWNKTNYHELVVLPAQVEILSIARIIIVYIKEKGKLAQKIVIYW